MQYFPQPKLFFLLFIAYSFENAAPALFCSLDEEKWAIPSQVCSRQHIHFWDSCLAGALFLWTINNILQMAESYLEGFD